MLSSLKKQLFAVLCVVLSAGAAYAQVSVADSQSAVQLVQKLAGTGVTISNAVLNCKGRANGVFTVTSSNLGLQEGIILTSGHAESAVGLSSIHASGNHSGPGDTSLNKLITTDTTRDACVLEFDFLPIGDTVKFRYVFGSEEYPGFACTSFNDVFGFFISGPSYSTPKNIALLPNTNVPVTINSTSGVVGTSGGNQTVCTNAGNSPFGLYYINNNSGTTIAYNGFLTVLTAIATVIPCSTYHLKLAIGDVFDNSYDSGVFLEAGSFSSNIISISNANNVQAPVPYCVRGCKNGSFTFKRQKVTNLPLTIKYQVAGTAINGTDYTLIPDSVVIPANDSVVTRTIVPLTTATGTKTVKLYVFSPFNCGQSQTIFDSTQITIYDSIYAQISTPDTSVCPGSAVQIKTVGDDILQYRWSPAAGLNDTTLKSPTATPAGTTIYVLKATLPNSTCPTVYNDITISHYSPPDITTEPANKAICNGSGGFISLVATGQGLTYQWQVSSGSGFSNVSNNSTYSGVTTNTLGISNASLSMSGLQYRCVVSGTCVPKDTSATATLTITTLPGVTNSPLNRTVCDGENTSMGVVATGSNLTYQWEVNTGSGFSPLSASSMYSGVNSNQLIITGILYSMNGYMYRCVVSGSCTPAATSNAALLTVNKTPEIIQPPVATAVCPDSPASFSITASATAINYQWQVNTGSGFVSIANNSTYTGANSASLDISAAPAAMHGYQYRCIVTGICDPPDTSSAAILEINTVPSFTFDAHDTIVCDGNNAAFTVTATGTALVYQWQLNTGTGFSNLSNNVQYNGANTAQLLISGVSPGMSGYQYRCYITGTCLPPDTSDAKTLTVNTLPAITMQPGDSTICENDTASFSITATGTGLAYQWQANTGTGYTDIVDNGLYSGTTTNILLIAGAPAAMSNYSYRCVVTGACTPADTSAAAVLIVNTRPAITVQPKDTTVCDGISAAFEVSATGTALVYQWQVNTGTGYADIVNNSLYSGATSNNLFISQATPGMSGFQYRCNISGTCTPPVTTTTAILTVNTLPDITTETRDSIVCEGDIAGFSITATGTALNYQWQVNAGSGFSDVVDNSTYSGAGTHTLLVTTSAPMDGYYYRCIVSGACTPPDTSVQARLTVYTRPDITLQPRDTTICDGTDAAFTIIATGTNATYQWQVNTGSGFADISNNSTYNGVVSNTLNIAGADITMSNYQYRCLVSGSCTPVAMSLPATLRVDTLPDITHQPADTTICEGNDATFSINALGSGLIYQWQVNTGSGFADISDNSIYSGTSTQTLLLAAANAGMNDYLYRCLITGNCLPADTSATGKLTIHLLPVINLQPVDSTVCEGQDVLFGISAGGTGIAYQWQVNSGSGYQDLQNDAVYIGVDTDSLLVKTTTAGMDNNLYRCIVSGICTPADTSVAAQLNINILPVITTQPTDSFVCDGNDAAFLLIAAGTGITYQWQVNDGSGFTDVNNNSIYSGAQSSGLSIAAAGASMDSFLYRCIVSGVCTPPDTSALAVLRVGTPPTIVAAPVATQICEGGDAVFSINTTGTALTYQWQVNTGSGYTDITDGGVYSGSNTDELMLTGVTSAMSGYLYRCIVAGACPPADTSGSLTLVLTVYTLPSVTQHPVDSKICAGDNTSFSAAGGGTGITYQWQVDTGTGYNNVVDNVIYSGSGTPTLDVTAAGKSMSGYKYRCVVKGVCLPDAITQTATLTVDTLPTVLNDPFDTTVCEQTPAAFAIQAEGTARTYQWQVNTGTGFADLSNTGIYTGAQSDTLKISATVLAMNGYQYRCIVNGLCTPPDTSAVSVLYTDTIPVITQHPVNDTICEGDPALYSIAATGTNLSYQWQLDDGLGFVNLGNNSIYSGVNSATLSLSGASALVNNYRYRCIVYGKCSPPDTSLEVILTVFTRPLIQQQPKDSTVCEGTMAIFAITGTGTGITYQWQVDDGTGFADLSNSPLYSGATADTLKISGTPYGLNNYYYRCIVSGTCTPPDTSLSARLTINVLPDITLQPHDSTICEGDNATFSIAATGTSITYQWQVSTGSGYSNISNAAPYSGATTNTLTITAGTAAMDNYTYRCIVNGVCTPPDTSLATRITVNTLPQITLQPIDSAVCAGGDAAFILSATGTALGYQWQVSSGGSFTDVINNSVYSGATTGTLQVTNGSVSMDGYLYRCIVSGTCVPPDTSLAAMLIINTPPAITTQPVNTIVCKDDTTAIAVICTGTALTYQWQADTGNGFYNLVNSASYAGATTATLSITGADTAMNGDKFRCIISGICPPDDTTQVITLSVYTAPALVSQPRDTSICPGESTTFKITAKGSVLTYQWQVDAGSGFTNVGNSATYSGAGTPQLTVTNAGSVLNGYRYRCIVSGYCQPPQISDTAILVIYPKPDAEIMPDGPTTACHGNTIVLNGLPATGVTYQWQFNDTDIPGATGAVLHATDSGLYKLVVHTDHCQSTSDQLTVTINPVPDASVLIADDAVICEDSTVLITLKHPHETYTYKWMQDLAAISGAEQYYYNIATPGVYKAIVTNGYGCTATSEGKYVEKDDTPPPYITTDNIYLCTQLFNGYQWYLDSNSILSATGDCHLARQNGLYKVKVTTSRGCVLISNGYVLEKAVVIWPNPTSGIVNILSGEPVRALLTDVNGKTILTTDFNINQIDISGVAAGAYMLKLYDKSNQLVIAERIVKL